MPKKSFSMPLLKSRRWLKNRQKKVNRRPALVRYRRGRLPPLAGYPKSKLIRLRWVENVVLDPATGSLDVKYFACNGMTDVTGTSSGHQPRGFDQQMLGYQHYTVIGAKFNARLVPQVSAGVVDSQTPFVWGVGVMPTASITGLTSPEEIIESRLGGTTYRLAGVNNTYGSGITAPSLTRVFSTKKYFNKTAVVGTPGYEGYTSANPTELAFFTLWGGPSGGAAVNPDAQNFIVTIEYLAVLSEPKILTNS